MRDRAGEVSQTKLVLPVPIDSTEIAFQPYQTGGSAQIDERRRDRLRPFVGALVTKIGRSSLRKEVVAKFMKTQRGYPQALRDARLSTVTAFLKLFADTFLIDGAHVRLSPGAIAEQEPRVGVSGQPLRRLRQKTQQVVDQPRGPIDAFVS